MAEETPETPEEEEGDDADVEAQMLAMMQEEIGEEGDAEGGEGGDADQLLDEEMRRAMGGADDPADAGGSLVAFDGGGMPPVQEQAEGIDRLGDIDVTVTVELGGNLIPIKDILDWTGGSTVELEPMENDPVDVLVNGKLFAHGEVVVVGDTFGVRILEMVDQGTE